MIQKEFTGIRSLYLQPTRKYPNTNTPLRLTIDEGFACFYTYKYFNGKISKPQAVEQMSQRIGNLVFAK